MRKAQIIDHTHPRYIRRQQCAGANQWNGAFYYSQEIVRNIIPRVKTERPWVTIKVPGEARDGAIVFIHNNNHPEWYSYLERYKDLILVCGIGATCRKVNHLGKAIYLPLSVDVEEVERYSSPPTKGRAFVGRSSKRQGLAIPPRTDKIEGLPREELLKRMAQYREVYAVGRTAIEAKILGCKVLPYDPRYPNPGRWRIVDNKDAARILQQKLDRIDGHT